MCCTNHSRSCMIRYVGLFCNHDQCSSWHRIMQFPGYLKDHASTLSAEDKTRYEAQSKVVAQIVATFDDPSFTNDDPQKSLRVVELMQEVRSSFRTYRPYHSTLLCRTDARAWVTANGDHGSSAARVRPGSGWSTKTTRWVYYCMTLSRCIL